MSALHLTEDEAAAVAAVLGEIEDCETFEEHNLSADECASLRSVLARIRAATKTTGCDATLG